MYVVFIESSDLQPVDVDQIRIVSFSCCEARACDILDADSISLPLGFGIVAATLSGRCSACIQVLINTIS